MVLVLLALWLAAPVWAEEGEKGSQRRCSEILTTLYPHWTTGGRDANRPRIEVRVCYADAITYDGFPQIVAWSASSSEPAVLEDGVGIKIRGFVVTETVFVLASESASRQLVYVVTYEQGGFRLALHAGSKAKPTVEVSEEKVIVKVPPEEGGEPVTVHEFPIHAKP
jgi:hypothetical protein